MTSWASYLGDLYRSNDVPIYAAPGRLSMEDCKGLPAVYIDVGQLDNFLFEAIVFVRHLTKAGVSIEFHVYEGVPHAFQVFAPTSNVARRRAFEIDGMLSWASEQRKHSPYGSKATRALVWAPQSHNKNKIADLSAMI